MANLRIYGDVVAFRRKVRSRLGRGNDLLSTIEGRRRIIETESRSGVMGDLQGFVAVDEVEKQYGRWVQDNRRLLDNHLGPAAEEWLTYRYAASTSSADRIDPLAALAAVSDSVRAQVANYERLQALLPTRRKLSGATSTPPRLNEVRAAGLISVEVVDSIETRMVHTGTRRTRRTAIGASKELVEAVLRSAIKLLTGTAPAKKADLRSLNRDFVAKLAALTGDPAPTRASSQTLRQFMSHATSLVVFTAEWRNELGDGHGTPTTPPRLELRHARLAIDIAESYSRFVVLTLDDAGLLPPGGT